MKLEGARAGDLPPDSYAKDFSLLHEGFTIECKYHYSNPEWSFGVSGDWGELCIFLHKSARTPSAIIDLGQKAVALLQGIGATPR